MAHRAKERRSKEVIPNFLFLSLALCAILSNQQSPQIACANYFIEPRNNDDVVPQRTSGDAMDQKIFMSKFMIPH